MHADEGSLPAGRSMSHSVVGELARVCGFCVLPAVILAIAYGQLLGHRSDYLGHYLAGYGGTLGLTIVLLMALPATAYGKLAPWVILVACGAAVALGAVFESSIYRIAKFDEVDFFSQSLGAVLACSGLLAAWPERKPSIVAGVLTLIASVGFLIEGYHYAFR